MGHLQKTIAKEPGSSETKDVLSLEVVMMDAVVILYHLGVSNRFKANAQQHNSVHRDVAQLKEGRGGSDANLLPRVVDGLRLINYSRTVLMGDKAQTSEPSNGHVIYTATLFDILMLALADVLR